MKQVDELIRGEMAAVESFDSVMNKISDENEKQKLSSIRMDHVRAVDTLKRFVSTELRADIKQSGPWGAFTKAFAGGASFFGDKAAIQALKVGEEHGIREYQVALEDQSIKPELKQVIRSELLPQQERHISMIEGYLH